MAQIIDPIPNHQTKVLLCCYVNATSHIQIVRITNIPNWYFERVVFPGQRLVFEALPQALLEIHTGMMASAILSDTIPCERLCITDSEDEDLSDDPFSPSSLTGNKPTIETNERILQSSISALKPALV